MPAEPDTRSSSISTTAALKPGQLAEDAINRRQLADRAAKSPAEAHRRDQTGW